LTPGRALDLGIAYVPADRRRTGLALALAVDENLILRHFARGRFGRGPLLDRDRIAAFAAERIERFDVRPPDPRAQALALSGGNQQRLVLGRELGFAPRIIVAHNPTRGLDVKATEFIHARLLEAARHGAAVVVVSSDLDEVLALSRRIYALFRGHLRPVEARDPVALGLSLGGAR
jgi:simple sugar transport system ATP-binding protein